MLEAQEYISPEKYCTYHRKLAADSLRLAKQTDSQAERERYLRAAVFCVKRALQIEHALLPYSARHPRAQSDSFSLTR